LFGDEDGKDSSGDLENGKNEVEKEQEICEKPVPNWARCVAKSLVQLPSAKEIYRITNVYSATVVCLVIITEMEAFQLSL